jgi:hypothetical protein
LTAGASRSSSQTSSSPSVSWKVTETISFDDVEIFFPTNCASIGSSRRPRSTRTARRIRSGRPDRPSGEEDVVAEDDGLPLDREVDLGPLQDGRAGNRREVIAVERDVEEPDGNPDLFRGQDVLRQAAGERDAPRPDSHQREGIGPVKGLDDLARHPGDHPVHSRGVHQTELSESPLCFSHLSP